MHIVYLAGWVKYAMCIILYPKHVEAQDPKHVHKNFSELIFNLTI